MQTDTIIVQYVNPRNGNRPPSIKDTAGNYYTISDAAMNMFQPNTEGELVYTVNDKGFKNAVSWCGQALPKDQRQPRPVQPGPQPVARSAPRPGGHDKDARMIYITGVVGRAMGSGKFKAEDIPALSGWALEGWKKLHETKAPQSPPPPSSPDDYGAEEPPFDV